MKSLRRRVVVLLALGLLAAATALAGQPRYVTVDIDGATQTYVYGINPSGDMVGGYVAGGREYGFVLRNGVLETIDYPGAAWTECYGINPQGDVVGQYLLPANKTTHGFLLPAGSSEPIALDVEQPTETGNANTMPFRIAPDGTIVGCQHQSSASGGAYVFTMHGFVVDAYGTSSDPLAGSMHTGVNAAGVITGHHYITNSTLDSYIIANGTVTWFSMEGYGITRAYDINTNGDVVGFYRLNMNASSPFHGFLYRDGAFTTIDVPFTGVTGTRAFGINPQGDIVGNYFTGGTSHGFLYTRRGAE